MIRTYMEIIWQLKKKKKKKNILIKVEQNCKYNTSEFAITSTSHTINVVNKRNADIDKP